MAPEIYNENYNQKVDIYAFGLTLLEIITQKFPFSECTNQVNNTWQTFDQLRLKFIERFQRVYILIIYLWFRIVYIVILYFGKNKLSD